MKWLTDNIYNCKIEIMGLAIILIMVFHSAVPSFYGIKNLCEIGVDLFLFLGGFTCTRSYFLTSKKITYYKKRLWRVLPPFLLLYIFIYGYEYLIGESWNWIGFFENITMWNNIAHNDTRMWYIPAVIFLYLVLPIYVEVCHKWKYMMWMPLMLVVALIILILTQNMGYLFFKMMWVRMPIFFLGINLYLLKDIDFKFNEKWLLILCLLFMLCAWKEYNVELRRLCFIPIVIVIVYFFDAVKLFDIRKIFRFMGTITLELYLIHEYTQVLIYQNLTTDIINVIMPFQFVANHSLGIQALLAVLLSWLIGILLAYGYHKSLEDTIYK